MGSYTKHGQIRVGMDWNAFLRGSEEKNEKIQGFRDVQVLDTSRWCSSNYAVLVVALVKITTSCYILQRIILNSPDYVPLLIDVF